MKDELTITITVHNDGEEKGSIYIEYGSCYPITTDKEHLLERIKDIINGNLDLKIDLWTIKES